MQLYQRAWPICPDCTSGLTLARQQIVPPRKSPGGSIISAGTVRFTGKLVHKTKMKRADTLTRLQDKLWTSALQWLPECAFDQAFVTGTGYHKLQLYDVKAQQRPMFEVAWRDARITALAAQPDGLYVWAANAKGHIQARSCTACCLCR
jgi:hypothetical protein